MNTQAFEEAQRRAKALMGAGRAKSMPEALNLAWSEDPALYRQHMQQRDGRSGSGARGASAPLAATVAVKAQAPRPPAPTSPRAVTAAPAAPAVAAGRAILLPAKLRGQRVEIRLLRDYPHLDQVGGWYVENGPEGIWSAESFGPYPSAAAARSAVLASGARIVSDDSAAGEPNTANAESCLYGSGLGVGATGRYPAA